MRTCSYLDKLGYRVCSHSETRTWHDENIYLEKPFFGITDIKHYGPVVTLSTQDNAKLLERLEPGFKRTINSNKYY